ncbi:hypothetical protein WCLP8_2950001 [uncultured Gammaproteobacteria bacterium]
MIDSQGNVTERSLEVGNQQEVITKPSSLPPGRKIAILVANMSYSQNGIPNLETPGRDVELVSRTLQAKFGFETRIVTNGTKQQITDILRTLTTETGDQDQVVLYYAGHGYLNEATGIGYWLPTDATTNSAKNWISTNDVSRLLNRIPAKNILLIADSCYSGSFTKEQKVQAGGTVANDDLLDQRGVMAMSSGGDEPVLDGEVNSPFARSLAKRLREVNSPMVGEKLFKMVQDDVVAETPQTPQYGAIVSAGYDTGADFFLRPKTQRVSQR